jgi:hypothetical protein
VAAWTDAPTFASLLTKEILTEYEEVLHRMNVRSASTIIALIREEDQFIRTAKKIDDLPDPDDTILRVRRVRQR